MRTPKTSNHVMHYPRDDLSNNALLSHYWAKREIANMQERKKERKKRGIGGLGQRKREMKN